MQLSRSRGEWLRPMALLTDAADGISSTLEGYPVTEHDSRYLAPLSDLGCWCCPVQSNTQPGETSSTAPVGYLIHQWCACFQKGSQHAAQSLITWIHSYPPPDDYIGMLRSQNVPGGLATPLQVCRGAAVIHGGPASATAC
jgi:hypothetical protein